MKIVNPGIDGPTVRLALLGAFVVVAVVVAVVRTVGASAPPPSLVVTPSSDLHSGETVSVSVGPNGFFTPNSHVNILECADPEGTTKNLPTDDSTCDGNTIEGNTVLVGSNGSFSEASYTVYSLPSSTLGEQSNHLPVCNQTSECVLFVGQNQNDFTAPKVFSKPFTIAAASGSSTPSSTPVTSAPTTTTTPATTSQTTVAAGTTTPVAVTSAVDSGSLADTGPPARMAWTVAIGTGCLFVGSVGRRLALRSRV